MLPICVQITCVEGPVGDTLLVKHAVIVRADSNLPVFSAEVYVKGGEDHIVGGVNCVLRISVSKPPDKLPAIDVESTFVIIIGEFVIFDGRVVKAEFQSVCLVKSKDLCAVT